MKKHLIISSVLIILCFWSVKLFAEAGPGTNSFEIDGDFGSSIGVDGKITDDGLTTYYSEQGSGHEWIHATDPVPYMGVNCYESWCSASPTQDNDRTEHKILTGWNISDGIRYFSLAIYVPQETDPNNWMLFSQWWQCDSWGPPLQLSLDGSDHIFLTRKYDSPPGTQVINTLYDFGALQRDKWYHFLFAVKFDNDSSNGLDGQVTAYLMNPETGVFEQKYNGTGLRLGWQYLPDGQTLAPVNNFVWKVGTYRGYSSLNTWVYYDNCRYGRTWSYITKGSLTGYQKSVLNLQFDESSGTTASDVSGYSNPGSLINGPVWSGGGRVGNCLYFDGTNDHVRVPVDTVDFDTGNYLTVGAWFKSSDSQSGKAIVNMDGTTNFRLYMQDSTHVAFYVYYPDGGHDSVTATVSNVLDGQWHHLVGVYNRYDSSNERIKIYLDGTKRAYNSGYSKPLKRGDSYLYIGRYSSTYFKGYIDEVTMHNYPMTDSQVQSLYQNP